MSLQLIDPISSMPFFQPNQVLTFSHLNNLAAYLYEQERYTRNKLIGSGIVCGLTFSWTSAGGNNAMVMIDDGIAITSAGYLIVFKQPVPYTYKRKFTRLQDFEPFSELNIPANTSIYELITQDEYDAETEVPKSVLIDADKKADNNIDRVLILLFDIQTLNIAKCLDENCDDKGKIYEYTPRPLLVPKNIIDAIVNADDTKDYYTEEGCGWKHRDQTNFNITYLGVPNLFINANGFSLSNITDNDELQQLFLDACRANNYVTTVKTKLNDIIDAYPSILKPALECMNFEITGDAGTAFSLGDLFENQVLTFPGAVNSTPVSNYSQYLYDYIRDVADCYNDLYSLVADLISECGGNEYCYPFHVMLGIPQTNDTLSCYKEGKFSESNYKYRSYFVPSPLVDSQFNLAEKIEQSLKRLVRVVAFFKIDADLTAIKIIPGKDYDTDISIRAIPYYYEADRFEDFFRIWNYDCTRHNKLTNPRGYHATNDENIFLRNDTRKINFYRIEGHIGNPVSSALTDIQAIQNQYNLPFNVISVPLNNNSDDETNASCSFEDLEAEYNYYRDRALGYLREITRWIQEAMLLINDLIKENNKTNTEILQRLQKYLSSIYGYIAKGMLDILYNARCIERFDYAIYKTFYTKIWEVVFDMYYANYTDYNYYNQNVLKSPNQALNSIINILSVPFLQPIYRIWYMYQYRLSITEQIQAIDLQTLASKNTGFEHLAGVRRGETFVLVSDPAQTAEDGKGIVVADFNIPSYNNCSCDCKSCNEDTPAEVKVSPFQKPIIMVIDPYQKESAITNDENDILKLKAHLDPKDNYVLELDSMGFYKADSAIDPSIIITSTEDADFGNVFEPMKESVWINGGEKGDSMNLVYNSQYLKGALYKRLNYVLTGNFETVTGNLYLIILGGYDYAGGTYPVYTNDEHTYMYYPYKSEAVKDINPQMMFNGATETKVIGNETKQVYTAASGNQYTIGKDKDELPYIDALSIKNPGVDNIPFILKTDDSSTAASVTMNVIDKTDKLPDNTVSGIIKNSDGIPIANAKLTTTSGKEVITNDKGEYSLADIKSGDMITVEKQGFETANIQVHSQMATDIQMQKTPLIDVAAVNKLDPTGKLANIASNINTAVFKNFMQ